MCLLKKSLYGLKQASRAWYHKIDAALSVLGFTALTSDHCIYIARIDQEVTFIVLYVDDLLLISNSLTRLNDVKRDLSNTFEMVDLGEAQYILGLQLTRDRTARTLSLSQAEYVRRVVERYGMNNSKHLGHSTRNGRSTHIEGLSCGHPIDSNHTVRSHLRVDCWCSHVRHARHSS